ncbi:hypothetical protein G3M55_04145, partial [Streptomyces sp. SID8455]|nr:hypothetical protein [Streptomyces sp. SID8455]
MTDTDPELDAPSEQGAEATTFPSLPARAAAPTFRRASGELPLDQAYGPAQLLAALAVVLSRHN